MKRSLAPIVALVGVVTGGLMLVVLTRGPVDDSDPLVAATTTTAVTTTTAATTTTTAATTTTTAVTTTTTLAGPSPDEAIALYDSGPADSGVVCPGGFPIISADIGPDLVAAIQGDTPFGDAAVVYSIDPGLAASRGVWLGADDKECFLFVELKEQLATALRGLPVGTPVAVDFEGSPWVIMARPFESLSEAGRSQVFALLGVSS